MNANQQQPQTPNQPISPPNPAQPATLPSSRRETLLGLGVTLGGDPVSSVMAMIKKYELDREKDFENDMNKQWNDLAYLVDTVPKGISVSGESQVAGQGAIGYLMIKETLQQLKVKHDGEMESVRLKKEDITDLDNQITAMTRQFREDVDSLEAELDEGVEDIMEKYEQGLEQVQERVKASEKADSKMRDMQNNLSLLQTLE